MTWMDDFVDLGYYLFLPFVSICITTPENIYLFIPQFSP